MKLALDGDLILPGSARAGATEKAVRTLAERLDLSFSVIHDELQQGEEAAFSNRRLYQRVFALVDKQSPRKRHAKYYLSSGWRVRSSPVISLRSALIGG
ncbi:Protein of unknown function [Izhakiella capsodis]|uniref:Uncharacterized protein n=1 Tax=Izhakiella capsodis TaxID=1367852 RepID=A0A1I4UG55_9GAMM|nr:Protein of unknown function [Izhakiella capsodis]